MHDTYSVEHFVPEGTVRSLESFVFCPRLSAVTLYNLLLIMMRCKVCSVTLCSNA